jgi:transcriptional regulator PpsR
LNVLAGLAPELASAFVALSSDIALLIDVDGSVRQVLQGRAPLTPSAGEWVGRPWADTVTRETRAKIEQLLRDVSKGGTVRQREVNLPGLQGVDIPVAYTAIRLGLQGPVLAVGRDLRAIAAIQQRFTESQQEMERDYWKRRHAESRYRMLFQVATDAVLVVDGLTLGIVEANRSAGQLFAMDHDQLVGKPANVGIDRRSWPAVEELLTVARATGRPAEIRVRLAEGGAVIDIAATPFRSDRDLLLLVRARTVSQRVATSEAAPQWADLVQRLPDAVVITDSSGRVLMANPAFVELCQLTTESQAEHRELAQWIADPRSLHSVLDQARRHGMAAQVAATLRGEGGRSLTVGVSAVLLDEGDRECLGFTIRRLETSTVIAPSSGTDDTAAALDALAELLGRKPLPELMRAATALAERHLIISALRRVGGDRDAAASLLGVGVAALERRIGEHGLAPDGSDRALPVSSLN